MSSPDRTDMEPLAPSHSWNTQQGVIVFGFSLGLLLTELCLTRVLSVFFYYHTAFFAVSLAMLGLGVGGVWVYLFPRWMERGVSFWMLATGVGIIGVPVLLSVLRFDHAHLRALWTGPLVLIFVCVGVCCFLPFLTGGMVIAWWFRSFREHAAALYAWDLVGAACGALLLVPLMETLGGPSALLSCGIWILLVAVGQACQHRWFRWAWAAGFLAAASLLLVVYHHKTDALAIQIDIESGSGARSPVLYKKWNAFSRVVLLDNQDWFRGLSRQRMEVWKDKIPPHRYALIDINAFAPFVRFDGDLTKVVYLVELVSNVAHHLLPSGQKILVIGPGGNKDILGALLANPKQVTGIEINPILVKDLGAGILRSFLGDLYRDPRVRMLVGDGRTTLQHFPANQRFDVIMANSVATWAAHSSGAMNLAEHGLYTQDACGLYLDRLSAHGILSVSLWDINQHALPLRWIRTCEKAAQQRGVSSLRERVAVVANLWDRRALFSTILISRKPWTSEQREKLRRIAARWHYTVLYVPGHTKNSVAFDRYFQNPDETVRTFRYNIAVATDDQPFFLYTMRWQHIFRLWDRNFAEEDAALANLLVSLLAVSLLLLVLLVGPLLWHKFRHPEIPALSRPEMVYFFAIGWGFMLVEIPLIQRLTLWLGHPTYALTVVLTALLFFSGMGSAWIALRSKHQTASSRVHVRRALATLVGLLVVLYVILHPILQATQFLPLFGRILVALLLLAPLGLLMGLPLPLGMQGFTASNNSAIPWAWGINGASSVVASVAALGLAVTVGFNMVLVFAAGFYLLAYVSMGRSRG